MGIRSWWILLLLPLICGCIPLPAPSTQAIDVKLPPIVPLASGETILVHGTNAARPHYRAEPYFTMGCMLDYEGDTVGQISNYLLKLNPVPGHFAIRTVEELQGEGPTLVFSEPILTDVKISAVLAAETRLRYIIFIRERIDNTLHFPIYIVPLGISACRNEAVLVATIWDVPSGKLLGTITTSSKGEFVGLAYLFHVLFLPQTQSWALLELTQELLKKITGQEVDKNKLPSWDRLSLPLP